MVMEEITQNTKLLDILAEYPWLKKEITSISPKFKILNSPIGKVMMGKATIAEMSKRSGIEIAEIISKLQNLIQQHQ